MILQQLHDNCYSGDSNSWRRAEKLQSGKFKLKIPPKAWIMEVNSQTYDSIFAIQERRFELEILTYQRF